jgi:hypothetical protein
MESFSRNVHWPAKALETGAFTVTVTPADADFFFFFKQVRV